LEGNLKTPKGNTIILESVICKAVGKAVREPNYFRARAPLGVAFLIGMSLPVDA
jgi:hypothetical protein